MKVLFISDIFGRSGRETVKDLLPRILQKYKPDIVLANAENLSHGNGFSPENIEEMRQCGIDAFTSGNHVWGNHAGVKRLDDADFPVIRPANFPKVKGVPGRGYMIVEAEGQKLLVINLMGRIFMKADLECPFIRFDEILEETKNEDLSGIFVDFHAEATSEKYALSFYVDGRASVIVGTHTHVPTKDARILAEGTAAITDVGMTGSLDSVIGVKKDLIIKSLLTQMSVKHQPENEGEMVLNAVVVELDVKTKKALNIVHVQEFSHSK